MILSILYIKVKHLARHWISISNIFGQMICSIVHAGEKSSNLAFAFGLLDKHNQEIFKFNRKLRSFPLAPILTFAFFLAVIFSMFIFIIPRFEIFFNSFDISNYSSTQFIINVSKFIRSRYFLILVFGVVFSFTIFRVLTIFTTKKFTRLKIVKDGLLINLPIVGNLYLHIHCYNFLQNLGILLSSEIHLVDALKIIINNANNLVMRKVLISVKNKVEAGRSLTYALSCESIFTHEDLVPIINVGETSANLAALIAASTIATTAGRNGAA